MALKWKIYGFTILGLMGLDPAMGSNRPAVFRVLRASPAEIVDALKSPMPHLPRQNEVSPNQTGSGQESRLAKYYRVHSKKVMGKIIEITLSHKFPLFNHSPEPVTLVLIEKSKNPLIGRYEFDSKVKFPGGKFIHSDLVISPHEQGARLDLFLQGSNFNRWVISGFLRISTALGFVSENQSQEQDRAN